MSTKEFYRNLSAFKTMGEQYNNLGNIMQGESGMWPGQNGIGWNADGTRALKNFATVEDGLAAQAFLLERYVNGKGFRYFDQIIATYAPKNDGNNVGTYTKHVVGKVDSIARALGYKGAAITDETDLKDAFSGKDGDILLAATVKAMNEVEVGEDVSNRAGSKETALAAVKKYRALGSYEGYSKLIGKAPVFSAPNKKHTGYVDANGEEHSPNDGDIDLVTGDMFTTLLISLLKALCPGLANLMTIASQPQDKSNDKATDLDLTKLIPADLLKQLGLYGDTKAQLRDFDINKSGHITQSDVPLISDKLKSSGVTVPDSADASQVLTMYAKQLLTANQRH